MSKSSSSSSSPPFPPGVVQKNVFFFLYEGFTDLDVFGSAEVYSSTREIVRTIDPKHPPDRPASLPYYHIKYVGIKKDTVVNSKSGCPVLVPYDLDQLMNAKAGEDGYADIFIIPGALGGPFTAVMTDKPTMKLLTAICTRCPLPYSVCTGAAIFALTGLLKGREATTNKQAYDYITGPLAQQYPALQEVKWVQRARWVSELDAEKQTGIATSSGISAGIDLTVSVINQLFGSSVCTFCWTQMEYVWNSDPTNDPFAPPLPPIVPVIPPASISLNRYSPFSAVWLYRSFLDDPDFNSSFNQIEFGQAIWTLLDNDQGLITGNMDFMDGTGLDTTGSILGDEIRLRSVGRAGTSTAGWVYEHKGKMAPAWPYATYSTEKARFIGSVFRTKGHSIDQKTGIARSPAGVTGSFICIDLSNIPVNPGNLDPLPAIIIPKLSAASHRLHLAAWQLTRNHWDQLSVAAQQQIKQLHWQPLRPAVAYNRHATPHLPVRYLSENGSGEDYLFWCRTLYHQLKDELTAAGYTGWLSLPAPTDPSSPIIPPTWKHADVTNSTPNTTPSTAALQATKTDDFYYTQMIEWDVQYKNVAYLRSLSLSELGCQLQFVVSVAIYTRFSALPRDPLTNEPMPDGRVVNDFAPKYNLSVYDHLCDAYAAMLHPVYWKYLIWQDARVSDWYTAHEQQQPDSVQMKMMDNIAWFHTGRWVQIAEPWTGSSQSTERDMQEVISIIVRDTQQTGQRQQQ